MFIITINDIDSSCHTLSVDAIAQKQRLIDLGVAESSIAIVEKDTFEPIKP